MPSTRSPLLDDSGRTDAEIYLTDIYDGKIVACRYMRKLADMMLPRFHEEYHGYHYNVDKALRIVDFVERFTCFPEGEKRGQPFLMEQFQRAAVEMAYGFVDENDYRQYRTVLMEIARKNGKGVALSQELPTPIGWRKMGDLHVGDTVFGQDGKPSTIIAESEVFDKPTYLITFEDGSSFKVTDDHIWTVQTKNSRRCARNYKTEGFMHTDLRKYRDGGWFETTTQEMFDDPHFVYKRADGTGVEYKYRVPMSMPVEYPEKDLPIDPYTFGYWIGDGSSSNPTMTVSHDDLDEAKTLIEGHGHVCGVRVSEGKAPTLTIDIGTPGNTNPFTDALRSLGVYGNKHIPDIYLQGSIEQRFELLRGLMDTDGYCSKAGQCEFSQKNELIVDQLIELCSSLGIKASKHSKEARCNGKPAGTVYLVQFWTDKERSCFNLKRKHDRLKEKLASRMNCKSIVSIERIPNEPTKCIAIDNSSHLYLVGRQYTATHNTSLVAALCLYHLTSDSPIELGGEVYLCANSEAQAHKCYGAIDAMVFESKFLSKKIRRGKVQKRGASGLNYDKNGSAIMTLAANPKKLDALSASAIVYDEIAACEDNGALLDVLEESTSSRKQPITWMISSENYVRHGVWDEKIDLAHRILDGAVTFDTMLPILYTMDKREDIFDESKWIMANPGIDVIKERDALRNRVNLAATSPNRLPSILTKEFCLRSGSYSAFLDINDCVNNTPIDFDIGEIPYCVVGFDLSMKNDLCCCVARFKRNGDDNIYEISRFWIPEQSIEINNANDLKERDGVPYRQWAADGWIDILYEKDRINNYVIIEFIHELVEIGMYPFAIGYDPWRVDDSLDRELRRLIGDSRCYPIQQTARVISPLMREHELDLKAHKVINPSPVMHHSRQSVMARIDNNGNVFPKKKDLQPHQKIDGFMAELFSLGTYKKYEEEYLAAINWRPPES